MNTRWLQHRVVKGHSRCPPTATILMTILMASAVGACAADAPGTAPEPAVRVIVRFKPIVADPLDPDFLARLANTVRVKRIDAIRPMSGDAYVLQVACTDPQGSRADDPCASALARLGAADAVLSVEVDRRERHQ